MFGKNTMTVWLIGTPEFGNLGDHKISEVEWEILRHAYPRTRITEITMSEYWGKKPELLKAIKVQDILVFHGGGNVGNLWPKSEYIRRDAFDNWKEQKKIIMPQSIYFTEDEEGDIELNTTIKSYSVSNLVLACRDENSFRIAQTLFPCKSIFVPDTVLYHKPRRKFFVRRKGAVLCLRRDKEKNLTDDDVLYLKKAINRKFPDVVELDTVGRNLSKTSRKKGLEEFMNQLCRAELVVTDRLHCMIFCALEGIPCIALDNSYHKLKGGYRWLQELEYIIQIDDVHDIKKWIDFSWKRYYKYPIGEFRKKFEPLLDQLREKEGIS